MNKSLSNNLLLPTEDIVDFLLLCLTSTYSFSATVNTTRKLYETDMRSRVSDGCGRRINKYYKPLRPLHQQCEAGLDMFYLCDNEASGPDHGSL